MNYITSSSTSPVAGQIATVGTDDGHIEIYPYGSSSVLAFTPTQARALAAKLLELADNLE